MMNHKRKKPRSHSRRTARFPDGSPAFWNILYHSRPRRRRTAAALARLLRGADPDGMVWDLGNRKPHLYFW
ncbi:hypothetical protein ACEYYA_07235 [Paracoccus sp. p3-h83]